MNICLLDIVGKWLSVAFLSIISMFNLNVYQEESMKVELTVKGEQEINVINSEPEYPTIINNDVEIIEPQNEVKSEIQEEITTSNTQEVAEVVEETPNYEEYIGKVTGYGPDCYGCSGRGNLACKTKNGNVHNLYNDGVYYNDETFGTVRIVAASKDKFPCGTIIDITKDGTTPITVVVLDRGGDMNKAWANEQLVWLDLAYDSVASAKLGTISGSNIKFTIKRWGW